MFPLTVRFSRPLSVSDEVVDGGFFDYNRDAARLVYQYSTTRMFYITLVGSMVFGLLARSVWVWAFVFFWLYGVNWVVAIIRHRIFLDKLIGEIGIL